MDQPLSDPTPVTSPAGAYGLQRFMLTDGLRRGVELLIVDTGTVRAAICPTRGMSLWKAHINGIDYGWNSPIAGPIHPNFVAIGESSGIGWLDGFDELLVRCGMRSFGAPEFDEVGRVRFPVHGRVGNLPAQNVQVHLDETTARLHVTAEVLEARFLQYNLKLQVDYGFDIGQPTIAIRDRITNLSGLPTSVQMLYHINVGRPILDGGSQLHLSAEQVCARDAWAAEGLDGWQAYLPPTTGYAEQVYFFKPKPDAHGKATVLLESSDASLGFAVHFDTHSLPYFSQWKHTAAEADGYVTGLEPGTGFPNPRSFEESKGRTLNLDAGASVDFQIILEGVSDAEQIASHKAKLDGLNAKPIESIPTQPDWCLPR